MADLIQSPPAPTADVAYNSGTYNSLPAYYTDTAQDFSGFVSDYLANINAPGGFSSGYTGARVAGQDPYQTQAYQGALSNYGSYLPYLNSGANTMQTGQNWMTDAYGYASEQPKQSFDSAGNIIANEYGNMGQVDPYYQSGAGALGQASSFIGNNATYDPNAMQQHLSPYLTGVNDEIARLGNERLFEDVLPNINSTFTGAGQFGSTRNADFTNRAVRDSQREVLGTQANAMNQAYGQAADDYLGWAKQGQSAGDSMTNLGQAWGGLGSNFLDRFVSGANIGTSLGNLGGQEANYGTGMAGIASGMSGLGADYFNLGTAGSNQGWTDTTNLYGIGQTGQDYNQSVLDNGYNDWLSRWTQPASLAGALSQMIPNYTGKLQPDQAQYSAPVPEQNNDTNDLLMLMTMMNQM